MLYKDLVYMVIAELKQFSDDSTYTEDHIIFLADHYRDFFIKKEYLAKRKPIPDVYYQTLCVDLEEVNMFGNTPCVGGNYLRSTEKLPKISDMAVARVDTIDYFTGGISYVSPERFKYAGSNKWMTSFIYATEAWDNYLYLKSRNTQFLNLKKVKVTAIFEDASEASKFSCDESGVQCEVLDTEFKCESAFVPMIIQAILKELLGVLYMPKDDTNNAKDDTAGAIRSKKD